MAKTIKIDPVTRIEGHARILLEYDDAGMVDQAYFCVNELRGFERILVGMEAHTMPMITARICGVCPTATTWRRPRRWTAPPGRTASCGQAS